MNRSRHWIAHVLRRCRVCWHRVTVEDGFMVPVAAAADSWRLVERYGDHRDWRLVFKRGDQVLDVSVPEQTWRAFDVPVAAADDEAE